MCLEEELVMVLLMSWLDLGLFVMRGEEIISSVLPAGIDVMVGNDVLAVD